MEPRTCYKGRIYSRLALIILDILLGSYNLFNTKYQSNLFMLIWANETSIKRVLRFFPRGTLSFCFIVILFAILSSLKETFPLGNLSPCLSASRINVEWDTFVTCVLKYPTYDVTCYNLNRSDQLCLVSKLRNRWSSCLRILLLQLFEVFYQQHFSVIVMLL